MAGADAQRQGDRSAAGGMTTPAAKWKAAERARHKAAGRVAVTVWIPPEARGLLRRYVKRLVERTERGRAG